ncbi:MAG: CorA family divalent cation transporter, partial [Bacteroidales bacterium]
MGKRKGRTTKHIINKSLEYIGGNIAETEIILVDYDESKSEVSLCANAGQLIGAMRSGAVHWVRVSGLSDTSQVELLGKHFGIHYVDMQDILIPQHMVKVQDNSSHISGIFNLLVPSKDGEYTQERIAIVFGNDFIITFQENKEPYFSEIAMALEDNSGNIRNRKPDYLFCLIMNLLIDRYVELISDMEDKIEELEDDLLESIDTDGRKQEIQKCRKQQQQLRKVILPLK